MTQKPSYTAAEIEAAPYALLTASPASAHSEEMCAQFATMLLHQAKRKPNAAQRKALGAMIADLLERDPEDQGGWLFRSIAAGSFTGGDVGYRPFMRIFDALEAGRMIEVVKGNRVWTKSEFTGGKRMPEWQKATRFRSTDWLRRWFADQGITRENWTDHFYRRPNSKPSRFQSVALRATKLKNATSYAKGHPMPVSKADPEYQTLTARMDRLNAFLTDQVITPFTPILLRRIFANGDDPAFSWNKGGRIYGLGKESFQTAKKAERAKITINGKATVEIDLRASHLTILVGLGYLPSTVLDGDPYEIEGLPREIVKQWVTMTISHGKRHKRWPRGFASEYLADHGSKLSADFPLRKTGDLILEKIPLIGDDGVTASVTWAELQFLESEVLLTVMEKLAFDHDCPSLPVHDSLIVPQEAKPLAMTTMKEIFAEQVGVVPEIN